MDEQLNKLLGDPGGSPARTRRRLRTAVQGLINRLNDGCTDAEKRLLYKKTGRLSADELLLMRVLLAAKEYRGADLLTLLERL